MMKTKMFLEFSSLLTNTMDYITLQYKNLSGLMVTVSK